MRRTVRQAVVLALLLISAGGRPGFSADTTPAPPEPPPLPTQTGDGQRRMGDKIAIATSLDVPAGEVVVGSVVCIGCSGRIDGQVLGDVVVVGGRLALAGVAGGQMVAVGSKVSLEPNARVDGDIVNVAGEVKRNDAQIGGQIVDLGVPGMMLGGIGTLGGIGGAFGALDALFGLWWTALTWVLLAVVLMLLVALVPDRIQRIAEEVPVRPVSAFLWGILAYALLPAAFLLLLVSCIGIPVIPFAYFAFKILKWLGMAGIFLVVGRRIGRMLGRDIPLLGGVLLGMLPFLALRALPFCVGWFAWFLLEIFGIGFVILTRAGRPGAAPFVPAPVVPVLDPGPPRAP